MAANQERIKCQNCGKENRPGSSFCSRCGTSFSDGKDPLVGRRVGSYVVEKHIGSGGSGAVYKGMHASLGKRVAIKVLRAELISDEETKARFDREAKVLASMEHPNIVSINDFGLVEGIGPYMVMEWLEGLTLFEARKQRGYMNFNEVVNIFEQLTQALSFMHARGIVHRDLKPENMMLIEPPNRIQGPVSDLSDFRLKLYDFGIALFTHGDEKRLTAMGMVVGTPHYMAPEQIIVDAPVDHRADLYAIGSILFELLTGRPPFWGVKRPIQVMESHLRKKPPLLRDVLQREFPPALENVLQKALAKNPAERYQDALEMCQALRLAVGVSESARVIPPAVSVPSSLPLQPMPPAMVQQPIVDTSDLSEKTVVGGSAPPIIAPRASDSRMTDVSTEENEWANTQQIEAPDVQDFYDNHLKHLQQPAQHADSALHVGGGAPPTIANHTNHLPTDPFAMALASDRVNSSFPSDVILPSKPGKGWRNFFVFLILLVGFAAMVYAIYFFFLS